MNRAPSSCWPWPTTARCTSRRCASCPSTPRRSGDAVPLTMVSPHRDETRIEAAEAFAHWYRDRTRNRVERAIAALEQWQQADRDHARAVEAACAEVLADWRPEDVAALREAL